jgi:hypothetical protein
MRGTRSLHARKTYIRLIYLKANSLQGVGSVWNPALSVKIVVVKRRREEKKQHQTGTPVVV